MEFLVEAYDLNLLCAASCSTEIIIPDCCVQSGDFCGFDFT